MYATFDYKKITFVTLITLILAGSVYGTFGYKEQRFGSVSLTDALGNWAGQQVLYLSYVLKRGGGNLFAGAFTSLDDTTETHDSRTARALPVLVYHSIGQEGEYSISEDRFADQMEALYDAGWRTITLAEFEAFMNQGQPLPERSFLLTFDDGAKGSYYPVDPVLRVLGFSALSFILPQYSIGGGTHYYLSSGEIETMLKSGRWEIGSHGQDSHEFAAINQEGVQGAKLANRIWLEEEGRLETTEEFAARVRNDLDTSKQNLESEFNREISTFAFPFGEFGQLSRDYTLALKNDIEDITRSIYRLAFYQTWEGEGFSFNYPKENEIAFMIKRIEPKPSTTPEELVQRLENGIPKDLPFIDDISTDKGWFSTWGKAVLTDGEIQMRANGNETGVATVLDGSGDWENYRVKMTVQSESKSGFVVFVRYQDNKNFAGCNFGNGFIHAEDTIDGNRRVINGIRDPAISIPVDQPFTVEATVNGRNIECRLLDYSVGTEFLDASLKKGGVGVKVWDETVGVAELDVLEVSVEPLQ